MGTGAFRSFSLALQCQWISRILIDPPGLFRVPPQWRRFVALVSASEGFV